MKNSKFSVVCRTMVLMGLLCCGVSAQAASTFKPIPQDTFGSHFGYWEFLPNSFYANPNKQLPIVIFFHGAGEVGNGRQPDLDVILKLGPPLILNNPSHPLHNMFDQNEAIVLAPQCPAGPGFQFWFSIYVSNFIRYARDHYGNRIDTSRIYLTGLSMGSGGIHELINNEPEEGLKAAAMLVTAAVGSASDTGANVGAVVPFWCLTAFGDSPWGTIAGIDRMAGKIAGTGPTNVMSTYPGSDVIRTATFTKNGGWVWQTGTNGASGVNPKLTLYPGGDHWSWGPTYDNGDVWTWLFAQRKGGVVVDTTAPAISLTSPTSGGAWTTTASTINLTGVASDNVGVAQVSWNNDRGGSGTASGTGNWSINNVALQNGVNTITVTAQDVANNRSTATLRITFNPPVNTGNGLNGDYYNTVDLSGPALHRVDASIDFNWGLSSPLSGISADRFSVRWSGRIQPRFSENYTFYTRSDDGVRLWVNGQLIIDNWTDHPTAENAGTIALQAGRKYDIRMEYYENSGDAVAQLLWSSQSQGKEIVPASQLFPAGGNGLSAEYFNRPDLTGSVLIRTDASINFDWAYGSPDASLNPDYFSVRWVGKVQPKFSETYTFYTLSDDGVRLWVNGVLVIDNWTLHGATENAGSITLQAGQKYDIKMEFYENWGAAVAKLSWSSASQTKEIVPEAQLYPTGTGLNVQYFNDIALNGVALERVDSTVNFDFGNGSPAGNISADNYSARWSGKVLPLFSETYTFSTIADDGVRLWVNGQLLIDDWIDHAPTERTGSIALVGGQKYDIRMEWYENTGGAVAKLSWQSSSQSKEIIPQSQLFAISTNLSSAVAFFSASTLAAQASGDAATATAFPSIAEVGQPIAFFAPVITADGLTYTWDFGDGATGEGASISHSYAAAGTYTATVTIFDSIVGTSTSTVTVTVLGSTDGTDGNGGGAGASQPIKVKKFQLALKFNSNGGDALAISGSLPVAKDFKPNGVVITTNVGGVTHSFTLNAKGLSAKGASAFKLTRKKKSPTDAQFQLRVKAGSFKQELADEGLLDADGKNQVRHIGLSILINAEKYATDIKTLYSSAKGKSGRAR